MTDRHVVAEAHAVVARRYLTDVWAKGRLDAIDELVDEDIVVRDTMGSDVKGVAKVKELINGMQAAFSDSTYVIDEVIVARDRVVVRATWTGVHRGGFFGLSGTGRPMSVPAVGILRVSGGRVVEDLGFIDSYAMFQQLGVLPERDRLVSAGPTAPYRQLAR